MVGTITFDPATNAVTAIGGTAGSPVGVIDLYNVDIAGSRTLKAAATSPFTASLTTAVKPCESLALKLSCVVTNFSVAGTVTLTGKDAWGNPQSEILTIAANGTVTSTKYFASIDASGVVAAGTFTVAITQPRWGVIWKQATNQYTFDCNFINGDATTATNFTDSAKQLKFTLTTGNTIINKANATLTLGVLNDLASKSTKNGILFITLSGNPFLAVWGGTVYLYSCTAINLGSAAAGFNYGSTSRIWNCSFYGYKGFTSSGTNQNMYNVYVSGGETSIYDNTVSPVIDTLNVKSTTYGVTLTYAASSTIRNLNAANTTYFVRLYGITVAQYLINCVWDNVNWHLAFDSVCTASVYRQYEFDLITDTSATVTLKNAAGTTVFSVTSDAATGAIATQTVTRGYYDQAHGDTLQDYGPFSLTITKAGKMPYIQTGIILSQKTNWLIQLRDQLSGTAEVGDVAATKTFYKDDVDNKLEGTLALTGSATEAEVMQGYTFYAADPKTKKTGTLTLVGTAGAGDIIKDKTAYISDPKTAVTGILELTGNASEDDVVQDKTFYGTDPKTKRTGTLNPVSGGGPATVTVIKVDPEEIVFVDGKPALLMDEKDPEIYTFIDKKKPC